MFNASFQAVAQYLRERTVEVRGSEPGGGSGVIWSDDGLIVTNAHVARDGTPVIGLPDGRTLSGRLVAHDRRRDLARAVSTSSARSTHSLALRRTR